MRKVDEVFAVTSADYLVGVRTSTAVGFVEVEAPIPMAHLVLKAPAIHGVTFGVHEEEITTR